jgi:E3 ubiquitin-protein ligase UBR3
MEYNNEDVSDEYEEFMRTTQRCYDDALGTLRNPLPPTEFEEIPSLQKSLVHRTFLQELVFWTAKFEFPQKIVCLLLNLLPDPEYKVNNL